MQIIRCGHISMSVYIQTLHSLLYLCIIETWAKPGNSASRHYSVYVIQRTPVVGPGQGLGCSLWHTHDHGPPRKRALSVCPLPYQKHWQDQEIPRPRFVRENCPCLRYVSPGPEQRSARWSARWHGCQATKVPEHRGTCGHPYTHQRSYQTCPDEPPLAASWTEDTIQATHPSVQGTKRTCAWVHCRPPTRIRANSITEVGRCPLANWAKDNHSVGSASLQQGSSGLMEHSAINHKSCSFISLF